MSSVDRNTGPRLRSGRGGGSPVPFRPPFLALAPLALALFACGATPPPPPPGGFDDHTRSRFESAEEFFEHAAVDEHRAVAKFVITDFGSGEERAIRFMDGTFYSLHDEWAWFRLLNGERVPGAESFEPAQGLRFDTIADVYRWAREQPALPLGLRWVDDGRLYWPPFYELGLWRKPRNLGLGSLMHVPAREGPTPRNEGWVFFLEYSDAPTHAELMIFFEQLQASLPEAIAQTLRWAVRSPPQEALAQQMERDQLARHDRIVRFRELAVAGEVEVYNGGLIAGRLRRVKAGADPHAGASPGDVLILEEVPDELPMAAALVTAVPQTPLAHLNVLARNRGIPNAYRGGVLDDLELEQLANARAPVLLHAAPPSGLTLKPISEAQYQAWRSLSQRTPASVPQVDPSSLPYTYDLAELRFEEVDALRPAIGGKAAGMLALRETVPDAVPDRPIVVTLRAYAEHVAPLRPVLAAMLSSSEFQSSAEVRYLLLEGPSRYDQRYPTERAQAGKEDFLRAHPAGDPLGDLVRAGGVVQAIRRRPIAPAALQAIVSALELQFGHLARTQGLRFRSSSTVEDIEGFNGAGLYESSTGFLDPAAQPRLEDRGKTVEWALLRTWASYWRFEAVEERRLEAVDSLSGNMAVLVHPRFEDPAELSNGVFLFTRMPRGSSDEAVLEVNVQAGALSVTNPPPGLNALPEVDRVRLVAGEASPRVERIRTSNQVPAGTVLLDDSQLVELFHRARAVADRWLAQANGGIPPAQAARAVTLDFELREVAAGWPALADGTVLPERVVIKQVRSLEPGLRRIPPDLRSSPFPRELLGRARRIERRRCDGEAFSLSALELWTDPLAVSDFGHAAVPFTGAVELVFLRDVPELGYREGERIGAEHPEVIPSPPHLDPGGTWALSLGLERDGLSRIEVTGRGEYRLSGRTGELAGAGLSCSADVLLSTPQEYLRSLL